LKNIAYRTHLAGKWHLGARPEWIPNAYGFDTSYGTLTGAADPYEKTNLADKEPERLAELNVLLAAELAKDNKVLPADLKGIHA
jgi:arylsulfatase A-like enzyme